MTTTVKNNKKVAKVVVNVKATAKKATAKVENPVPEKAFNTPESIGISNAVMTKAYNNILKETQTLNQCVKTFSGILNNKISVGNDTRTIKQWLALAGVEFSAKGGLTAKAILNAWQYKTEKGAMQIYKNVPAYVITGSEDKPKSEAVWSYDSEAQKWVKVVRFQLTTVEKWSCDVILKGLLQGSFPEKTAAKAAESAKAFDALKNLYRFEKRNNKNGVDNKAIKVNKTNVNF